jgi:hypothetical protein
MRILVRTSRSAIWARRLGSFALPLVVVPILMHRGGAITSEGFAVVEVVGVWVALLALASSFMAFARIWVTGDRGWFRALSGLLLGLACLAPAGVVAVDFVRYPLTDDLSTQPADPPPLVTNVSLDEPSASQLQRLAQVFPDVRTRTYPLDAQQIYELVNKAVTERGWDVRLRREPSETLTDGQVNAVAMTTLGFRDEVSIRVRGDLQSTSVDMRSASLTPFHEPGSNGRRIEEFLGALDARVTALIKNEPVGAASADDSDADQPPVVPAPAPGPRERKR